jgi:hypothetical protein
LCLTGLLDIIFFLFDVFILKCVDEIYKFRDIPSNVFVLLV